MMAELPPGVPPGPPPGDYDGRAFTDLHCHVVPAVDDGVKTLDEAVAALGVLHRAGFGRVAVTPHIRPGVFPNEPEHLVRELQKLVEHLRAAGAPHPQLRAGAEHWLGPELEALVEQRRALTWADDTAAGHRRHYLLVEVAHHQPFPLNIDHVLFRWRVSGFFAILAHPERYSEVMADPDRARRMAEAGVVLQVDLTSLGGKFGRKTQKLGRTLVEEGIVAIAASDLHAPRDEKAVSDGIDWLVRIGASERLLVTNPDRIWKGLPVEL